MTEEAKGVDAARKVKRFSVCRFPSLFGTPWGTNIYPVAVLFAVLRLVGSVIIWAPCEIRVIDGLTGEHRIIW